MKLFVNFCVEVFSLYHILNRVNIALSQNSIITHHRQLTASQWTLRHFRPGLSPCIPACSLSLASFWRWQTTWTPVSASSW